MGIALFTFGGLMAPLQGVMSWLANAPAIRRRRSHTRAHLHTPTDLGNAARICPSRVAASAARRDTTQRPLRVVRVVDVAQAGAGAGRMVISGRMADVCAELDRLAALEAAAG